MSVVIEILVSVEQFVPETVVEVAVVPGPSIVAPLVHRVVAKAGTPIVRTRIGARKVVFFKGFIYLTSSRKLSTIRT